MDYRIATPADREDVVDFANYVFSQAHRPHDFKTLLPKEYADHVLGEAIHYLACREDGHIRAMVADRPQRMRMGETVLNTGFIGTVSVHPYARGEGHMKHLMQMMLDDAQEKGFDLLALGGLRQRYGYFGFECGGAAADYDITETNVRHALQDEDDSAITFTDLTESDPHGLDFAWKLANARKIGCDRPLDAFLDIMHSWESRVRVIREGETLIGYVMGGASKPRLEGYIGELGLQNERDLRRVIKALFREDGMTRFTLTVAPYETERAEILGAFAEHVRVIPQECIRVLNWTRVLNAALSLKADYATLTDGETILEIDGTAYALRVESGRARVETTDAAPDRVLSGREAVRALFGVESALFRDPIYHDWLPLPMFFSPADTF